MHKYKYILSIVLLLASVSLANAQTYVFAQLQGSPNVNTTGWSFNGTASAGDTGGDGNTDNDEIVLTIPASGGSGGIFYNQSLNLTQCQKWTAEFEFRMFDGNGADGIAFCFIDAPPTGFVVGGGVGIPGSANGLKVVFDTFNNLGNLQNDPSIQIRYGVGYHESNAPFGAQPTLRNSAADSLNFLRSNEYQSARITYNNGNIEVFVNNTLYLTGTYLINFTGYVGFTSSTGAFNDRNSIRNVTIYTEEQAISDAGPNAGVSYCSGGSVQIGTTNNPNYTYSWSPATGLNQTNISNPLVTLANNGSTPITQIYTVTTTLTANPVCPTTDNIVVTINPTPTSTFSLSSSQTCANQPITVTYTGNMNGAATFNWNFGGGTIVSGSGMGPYQISWPTAGAKQIRLSVTKYGCTSVIDTNDVTVNTTPTSTFTTPASLCKDEVGNIIYTGTGTAAATYNWNFDGGTVVTGTNAGPYDLSWATAGLKNLSLTVTENGCVSPITQDTTRIHAIPVIDLNMPTNMCAADTVLIGFVGTPATAPVQYWDWSGGTGLPIAQNPSPGFNWTIATAGTYTMFYQVTANGCASDTVKKDIIVTAIPTATFTSVSDACAGDDVALTYTGTGSPTATYVWQHPSGILQSGSGYGPLTLKYATAGNYNISLTVTENNCVSTTETAPIAVHAVPTSTFDIASGICVGQTSPLNYTGTGTASATFDWSFDGVEVISGTGIGPYVLGDANLGTFDISLQVTENNCVSPVTTHQFLVLPSPSADFSATPLVGCNPLPVQFKNLTPTQPGIVYEWNFGSGSNATEENPLNIYNDAGSFTVTLKATNGFGCSSTHTKPAYVKVTEQPVAGFTITPEQVTMDDPTVRIIDNSSAAETWTYTMGDGTSYNISSPFHGYISEGEYEVVQVVANALGCTDKTSMTVTVIPFTNVFIPNGFTPNGDFVNEIWMPTISYIKDYEINIYDRWGGLVFHSDDLFTGWNGKYFTYGKSLEGGVYTYNIKFQELSGKKRELLGHVTLIK